MKEGAGILIYYTTMKWSGPVESGQVLGMREDESRPGVSYTSGLVLTGCE